MNRKQLKPKPKVFDAFLSIGVEYKEKIYYSYRAPLTEDIFDGGFNFIYIFDDISYRTLTINNAQNHKRMNLMQKKYYNKLLIFYKIIDFQYLC